MEKIDVILWDELIDLPAWPLTDAEAELAGFLNALPAIRDGRTFVVSCPRLVMSRRLLKLWKGLNETSFNATIESQEGVLELDRKRARVRFRFPAERYGEIASPKNFSLRQRWAWFRGVWGAVGALYLPQSGYYMALRVKDQQGVGKKLSQILRSASIVPGSRIKHGRTEYMIRSQEAIVTCLSRMGLVKTTLALEDTAIVRSMRSEANKRVNCDAANIGKTIETARQQLAFLDRVDALGLWNRVPELLRELARARRENPSASLRELGQMLQKPVSKSTVEYRWRKLESIIWDNN